MMAATRIEWATDVWNPVTGCTPVSEGCQNCYAARMAKRLAAMGKEPYARHGFTPISNTDVIGAPCYWRKPRRVFVCSMGDLFHERISAEWIGRVYDVIAACQQHTFYVLTKRPQRIAETDFVDPPPNCWIGTSVETQDYVDRIAELYQVRAPCRFVSLEPLLGPINLDHVIIHADLQWVIIGCETNGGRHGRLCLNQNYYHAPHYEYNDWLAWAESIVAQCHDAHVPVFVKGIPGTDGRVEKDVTKFPKALRAREWPT